jgi:glutamate dehydrogenase (NAD(P)+)
VRLLAEEGARIVAVSDEIGGSFNPEGLDVPGLFEHFRTQGTVQGTPGAQAIGAADPLFTDCDVLIPAALGTALTSANANAVRARLVIEAANGPTDPEADAILESRGIVAVPDILAGAGGAVASYFEWLQNLQHASWEEERVNSELEKVLKDAYERVAHLAKTRRISLRTAAYALAIQRVGKAAVMRGI